jgi:YD repeat-containing protein
LGNSLAGFEYGPRGNVTRITDSLGRETVYEYDPANDIDLLRVKQKNPGSPGGYDLLASFTYNAQHRPLTTTDASGQTTTYTWSSQGQILTLATPPRTPAFELRHHVLKVASR